VRVVIVVPCRDGGRWLPGLLASVREQTRAVDGVLVVDDASRDDSVDVARAEGAEVLALEHNVGS
jgi:glycosyltransferase involved in cell wall biosynthesis